MGNVRAYARPRGALPRTPFIGGSALKCARRAAPGSAPDSVSRFARRLRRRRSPPRSGGGHPPLAPAGRRRRPPPCASRAARRRFAAPRPHLAVPLLRRFAPTAGPALSYRRPVTSFLRFALWSCRGCRRPDEPLWGFICRALPGVFICCAAVSSALCAATDGAVTRAGSPPSPRHLRGPPPLVGVPRVPRPRQGRRGYGTAVSGARRRAFLSAAASGRTTLRRGRQAAGQGEPPAAAPPMAVPLLPPCCRSPCPAACRLFRRKARPLAPALPRPSVVVSLTVATPFDRPAPDPRGRSRPSDTHDRPTDAGFAPRFARRPIGGKPPNQEPR